MTATLTYQFGGYTLRPTTQEDFSLAAEWTEADPHHRDGVKPDFWLIQGWQSDSYVLFDAEGPVFMTRIVVVTAGNDRNRAVEMHIQFPPEPEAPEGRREQHARIALGLVYGLKWLEPKLRGLNVREIYFESTSEPLIRFATRKLGFRQAGNRLAKHL